MQHRIGYKLHSCGRSVKYISFKKCSFGQKRPYVLRDFVPRGVFLQLRCGRVLNYESCLDTGVVYIRACTALHVSSRNLFFILYAISRVADFERYNWLKTISFIK